MLQEMMHMMIIFLLMIGTQAENDIIVGTRQTKIPGLNPNVGNGYLGYQIFGDEVRFYFSRETTHGLNTISSYVNYTGIRCGILL